MRIPKRIVQLPRNANLHREDVLAIVDQNNRTSKISLLQLAEFLSGTSQTLAAGNDYVTEGEYDDVGKEIILSRNDGAQIKITGFTGGQDLYTNETPVPEKVGGVEEGTTFLNKTMEEVFNMLFYPTLEPENSSHSTNLGLNHTGLREVGTILDLEMANSAAGGSWTQDWQGSNLQPDNYAGEALSAKIEYTGDGSFNNINSLQITGKYGIENVGYNNYKVVEGTQSWQLKTTFAPGEEPIDSDGNVSQVINNFGGGDLTSTKSIIGTYPIYVGISSSNNDFEHIINGSENYLGGVSNPGLTNFNATDINFSQSWGETGLSGTDPNAVRHRVAIPTVFGSPSFKQVTAQGTYLPDTAWSSDGTKNNLHNTGIEYTIYIKNKPALAEGDPEFPSGSGNYKSKYKISF